jgi:riboflavin kinase/FMN adenylyltransferase
MQVIEGLDRIGQPFPKAVITIGNFDGVHIGHQALLHEVVERADAIGGTPVAMTFDPHPNRVLCQNGHPPLITPHAHKCELIARTGIGILIVVPFTREFAALSARQFVEELLVRRIGVRAIVVGRDYAFGRHREGNLALLQAFAARLGFEVRVVDWIQQPQAWPGRISSTTIRELVMEGRVDKARRLLGRPYQVRGTVVAGRNRGGKLLGFPTANLHLQEELCPGSGVYAVTVEWGARLLPGVANIGYSPTFEDHLFTVEVHLIDFEGDLYGEAIRVNFIRRIREEIKFAGVAELAARIAKDVVKARRILETPLRSA